MNDLNYEHLLNNAELKKISEAKTEAISKIEREVERHKDELKLKDDYIAKLEEQAKMHANALDSEKATNS